MVQTVPQEDCGTVSSDGLSQNFEYGIKETQNSGMRLIYLPEQ